MAKADQVEMTMGESANQLISSPAREAILRSVRDNLAASALMDLVEREGKHHVPAAPGTGSDFQTDERITSSAVETFRQNLEMVGGHCIIVKTENEAAQALGRIISDRRGKTFTRIALSDSAMVERLVRAASPPIEATVTPDRAELFQYDAGVTMAQAAIADTGTLVLESDCERHRLVSLVPPVHIAIVNAEDICETLGEALSLVSRDATADMSRVITFITGPSRTADIELTLTVGVHGPKELRVILNEGPRLLP